MKLKKLFLISIASLFSVANLHAQDFDSYFTSNTLRLDYVFAGSSDLQQIYVDKLNVSPGWYGKRKHLAEVPAEGNGQVVVRDHKSQKVIYKNSFSTLFQEWQTYDQAKGNWQSFENVFLVPMPKDTVDVTVFLTDNRRQVSTSLTHQVVPTDILIRHIGEKNVTPYTVLQKAADPKRCINIAFVAEGYTQAEMGTFEKDCKVAIDALFAHEPFKSKRKHFNIVGVQSASEDSGTSEPRKGIWKSTVLSSHFDTFYSERYLTTLNIKDLHDVLAGIPYEHIIILVNSEHYGGGGILNSYNLTSTHHAYYKEVVVHEFGHSFAGLADEYAYDAEPLEMYPLDIEPWEPNITTKVDFNSKWADMMNQKGVGVYEGAGYTLNGVYRPSVDCRMRSNQTPEFCKVCQRALTNLINFYVE